MVPRILVVDDEKDLVELISYNLEREGFGIIKAYDGETALRLVQTQKPDLVILDLMLPGIQGMEVGRFIRKNPEISHIPIIMVTAKNDEFDKVLGLEMGADDYITKPFSVRELIARVRAVLRRFQTAVEKDAKDTFGFQGLLIDFSSHSVTVDGMGVELSPTEFRILSFLTRRPGRVYTRDQILDHVWGDAFVEQRTVDVHIKRLRSQIEKDASNPQYILTVRGVGYKFTDVI
ncbi:MAG: response regulator [Deltaproteobacteria bacterium]|nr:response regulator [Deltaproteobacteria bacterium]